MSGLFNLKLARDLYIVVRESHRNLKHGSFYYYDVCFYVYQLHV